MGRERFPIDVTEGNGEVASLAKSADGFKNVEDMLRKLTATPVPKASPVVKKASKLEEDDCLEEAGKEKKAQSTSQTRPIEGKKKGYSFGTNDRMQNNCYNSPALDLIFTLGQDSPGPMYTPMSFTDHATKAQSFPKGPRLLNKFDMIPGPQYDVPGALGRQVVRESAPSTKFGTSARFFEGEFISRDHCKGAMSQESPAPNMYSPEMPGGAPSFSFSSGGRDLKKGKLFISRDHAARDGMGANSPGPVYSWSADLIQSKGPAFSFGSPMATSSVRSCATGSDDGKKVNHAESPSFRDITRDQPGLDSPGPGRYSPMRSVQDHSAPSYTFGTLETTNKRFLARDLVQPSQESPGPQYHPKDKLIKSTTGPLFAYKDPALAATLPRFSEKQYLSSQMAFPELAGRASPGPAAYTVPRFEASGPAYTMGKKEKILMKRISPGPERARYLSGSLMKENMGTFSPGPKYRMPDCIGNPNSIKYTFGMSDRSYDDLAIELKEKMGTIDKPYIAPCEARFYSTELQKEMMRGKFAPGPKYNPKYHLVEKRTPAYGLGGKWRSKDTPKPTKEEVNDDIKKAKLKAAAKDITAPSPPTTKFGTSKRGFEDAKGRTAAGKDSPGPVYCPNFEAVSKKTPAPTLGGLH